MGSKQNKWTDTEKDLLIEFYPKFGPLKCSEKTGRTTRACQEMAKRLKLKRRLIYDEKDEFLELVNSCTTYTECIIKLGLSPRCSGNFQTIQKYIRKYNIDISHFDFGYFQKKNKITKPKSLDEVLTKNSFYSRTLLKERFYKDGIKEKKCEICGMGEDWHNGSKIVHILDHINGDPYDNRIENLRIVCPNCNSTLPTNNGRNKSSYLYDSKMLECRKELKYHKCKCGKLILKVSSYCRECSSLNQRKVERPTLDQLLSDVENIGYRATGRKNGVTDNTIKKWIKKYKKEQDKKIESQHTGMV